MTDYCRVVEDLWPLYVDNELSEESRRFVEEHIKECPNCLKLNKLDLNRSDLNLQEVLAVPPSPGSAEGFMLRLKRRIRWTAAIGTVAALIIIGSVWFFSGSQAGRVYREEMEQEKQFFQEQLVALEEVSPPSKQLLNKLGLEFVVTNAVKSPNEIKIDYAIKWKPDSPVEWVITDRHWFSDEILVDADSGQPLRMLSGGGSSSAKQFEGHIEAKPENESTKKVVLKTRTLYALAQPEQDISTKFDYTGGKADVELGKRFSYRGVDFIIDNLQLNDDEFIVNYRQLTPASETGVYVLTFTFDDLLGNRWHTDPEADLVTTNPKHFTIRAPQSPSKKWEVSVNKVVQVIPGIKSEVELEGAKKH